MAHLIGIDLGSSSVKVSLVDSATGRELAHAQSPSGEEMPMDAAQAGWAEQDPAMWWRHTTSAFGQLSLKHDLSAVRAIGISYQMHGLVMLDREGEPVRPSIIWCDSRAVELGRAAGEDIGQAAIAASTLNSPGNFTASKWAWVAKHEPQLLERVSTVMLPGDYIAYRLTGERSTTSSGLSEMILWDFERQSPASSVLQHYGLDVDLLPPLVPNFGDQGGVTDAVASALGLPKGVTVNYRAGDQPNNAYSLNVLEPGETAATAGTSGVVYAVTDERRFDKQQRVNTFAHVNDSSEAARLGILLCINGTGSAYAWLRRTLGAAELPSYPQLNDWAARGGVAPDGLLFYPFGNGAERLLGNRSPGARLINLSFTRHGAPELCAAVQDGIAASLAYGAKALAEVGAKPTVTRAGRANLFLSDRFCGAFTQLTGVPLELYDTDGAQGAARAAGVGVGIYASHAEALTSLERIAVFEPNATHREAYAEMFNAWCDGLA